MVREVLMVGCKTKRPNGGWQHRSHDNANADERYGVNPFPKQLRVGAGFRCEEHARVVEIIHEAHDEVA